MRGRESGVESEIMKGRMIDEVGLKKKKVGGVAYLITITRLTEVRGLRMCDGPYTIAIATIDLS